MSHLLKYIYIYQNKELESLTKDDLIHFNTEYILKKNLSSSYQNQVINAIKLFYRNRFNRTMEVDYIQRPNEERGNRSRGMSREYSIQKDTEMNI